MFECCFQHTCADLTGQGWVKTVNLSARLQKLAKKAGRKREEKCDRSPVLIEQHHLLCPTQTSIICFLTTAEPTCYTAFPVILHAPVLLRFTSTIKMRYKRKCGQTGVNWIMWVTCLRIRDTHRPLLHSLTAGLCLGSLKCDGCVFVPCVNMHIGNCRTGQLYLSVLPHPEEISRKWRRLTVFMNTFM